MKTDFKKEALLIAEERGVIEYEVVGSIMTYYANYPIEHSTIKVLVNMSLNTESRVRMSRYMKKGNVNMGL